MVTYDHRPGVNILPPLSRLSRKHGIDHRRPLCQRWRYLSRIQIQDPASRSGTKIWIWDLEPDPDEGPGSRIWIQSQIPNPDLNRIQKRKSMDRSPMKNNVLRPRKWNLKLIKNRPSTFQEPPLGFQDHSQVTKRSPRRSQDLKNH